MTLTSASFPLVAGKSFSNARPRSARPYVNQHVPYSSPRPSSAHPTLPAVSIQGHSINRLQKSASRESATDQSSHLNNPPSTPRLLVPGDQPLEQCITPEPPGAPEPSQEPEEQDGRSPEVQPPEVPVGYEGVPTISPVKQESLTKAAVEKVDIGINCPSVPSVAGEALNTTAAGPNQEQTNIQATENQNEPNNDHGEENAAEAWPAGEDKTDVEKKVRFADEVKENDSQKADSIVFFITEDEQNVRDNEVKENNEDNCGDDVGATLHDEEIQEAVADEAGEGRDANVDISVTAPLDTDTNVPVIPDGEGDTGDENSNVDAEAEESDVNPVSSQTNTGSEGGIALKHSESHGVSSVGENETEKETDLVQTDVDNYEEEDICKETAEDENNDGDSNHVEEETLPVISINISPKPMSPVPSSDN